MRALATPPLRKKPTAAGGPQLLALTYALLSRQSDCWAPLVPPRNQALVNPTDIDLHTHLSLLQGAIWVAVTKAYTAVTKGLHYSINLDTPLAPYVNMYAIIPSPLTCRWSWVVFQTLVSPTSNVSSPTGAPHVQGVSLAMMVSNRPT